MLFREILMPVLVSAVVLITMAYLTYAERRILGSMQFRHGPNRVGPAGLLQPIADAIKLIFKQHMTPKNANGYLFIFAPIFAFFISMIVWAFIPVGISGAYILNELSLLWIMMISACHVYGLLLAGWASNSKYALLGALRASAQVLSYELALSLIFLTLVILSGSLDLNQITLLQQSPERMCIEWNGVKYPPLLVLYCICIIAETHRAPFDIAEGESELVAGYHVEYGSWGFALFFLAEYIQMIVASVLGACLFFGGAHAPWKVYWLDDYSPMWVVVKTALFLWLFIHARATFPRYRYDQLMTLGWTVLIPLTLIGVMVASGSMLF